MSSIETYNHTPSQIIKTSTENAHQDVESLLIPMLSNIETSNDYATILKIFYGFFHPLEHIIKNYITTSELIDIDERRQSDWIKKDLQTLNITADLKLTNHLPVINNKAKAFGALYVMEGSTLGGRMISKMLLKNKKVDLASSINFFNGYEDQTGNKWKSFLNAFNHFAETTNTTTEIGAAANETFINLKTWILENDKKQ